MAVVGVAWAQSDYSTTETSNVALAAGTNGSACTVNGENGIKVGTSSKGGDMKVTVPAGTAYLHVHAAAWNNVSGLSLNISGATASPTSIALTSDSGVSGNSPFTLSGNASDYYFVIELSDITAETTLTFTTSIAKRFVIWGVNAEEDGGSGSTLEDNDLALTGAPVALTFDLYDNAEPQVINYTTSSTGAVTIPASNFFETAIDETNKTITVTPVAVTNGVKEAAVNQAADDTYKAGSASFTVDITDSTPFAGGDVTFVCGTDVSETTSLTKNNVTMEFESGGGVWNRTDNYRLYSGKTLTISTSVGTITKIVFSVSQNNFSGEGYNKDTKTWTGDATSITLTTDGGQVRFTPVAVTVTMPGDDPYISANNVNIAYDATSGEIAYTITNPVPGTLLQATADADWVSDITVGDEAITFTTTANEANTERVATFTLTYEGAEDKTVTVTQAAAPVVYTTIPDLFAAATSTSTPVAITFNNWVISAVKGSNAYLTDNAGNGLIIYQSGHDFNVNDVLSGTASCNLVTYQGSAELTALTASTEGLTVTAGGTVTEQNIAINELGGVNTGALLAYENLTYNGTALVDADNNAIEPYSTLYSYTFEADKVYNVKGIYKQYTTNTQDKKQILPRSADDIEEVVPTEPTVTVNPTAVEVDAAEHDGTITVSCENMGENLDISVFFCEESDVTAPAEYDWITADIDNGNNVYYIIEANTATEARKAYMVVKVADADTKEVYTSKLITFTQAGKELPSVTWDLTTDSYSSASEDLVTWTSDFATMTNAKGSSTTKANNYLGGNNNHTRFYKNQVLTITPQSGYAVTSIVINAISGNVNGFNGENAWTNATVSVNGTVVTITPTNINLPVSVTISEACRATGVKVYYEESDVMVIEIKKGFTATTFSCNKALDFTNADVTAQIITDEQGTTQDVTVVPAETGLYITGQPGVHEISVADASAETDNVDSNKLKAVMEASQFATQNSVTFYAFGKQKGKEAFYKIPTSGYNVPAGKAVLRITKANAPEMIVVNGGTTGVESIENSQLTIDNYYTVDGRLVNGKPTQKGIYIVGGRKVVVK